MDFQPTTNPYERYEMAAQRFRDTVARKKDMEDRFHPSMLNDYNNVKAEMVRNAIELLRIGVQKRTDETNVYLTIEDEEYRISRADMMKAMDKKQWDDLFPTDNIQTIKAEIDNGEDEDVPQNDAGYNSYNMDDDPVQNMQNNPLAAFVTALCAPFMASGNGQVDTGKMMMSLQQVFQPKPVELSDEIGNIQKRILRLEKQRDAAIDEANRYHRQLTTMQEKGEASEQAHREELEGAQKSLDELKEEKDRISSKLDEAKRKLSEKENSFQKSLNEQRNTANKQLQDEKARAKEVTDALNKKVEDLKTELEKNGRNAAEELENSLKKAKADADNAVKKAKDEAEVRISDISAKLAAAEEKAKKNSDEVIKQYEDRLKEKDKALKELEAKTKELEAKLKELDDMKAEVEAGKKRQSELQSKITAQEQEIKSLEELAYNDRKAGVLNNNAFNRDFPAVEKDKDNTCLVITGVRNMRLINEKYGRAAGDEMLKVAAEACKKEFGDKNVYRVFNDEFAIIAKNDFNSLVNKLENVKDILSAQQISIVYGIAVGSKVPDIRAMVSEAENAMLAMKSTPMGEAAPIPDEAPNFSNKKADEPEDLDMSEMLEEYMQSGN